MECETCEFIKNNGLKLIEDEHIVAYMSPRPMAKGHMIVVPKNHYPIFENIPDELVAHIFSVVNKLSTIAFETLGCQGTNILINNGLSAGQIGAHFQVNIIPRKENDGLNLEWQPKKQSEDEFAKILDNILNPMKTSKKEPDVMEETDEENYLMKSLRRIP